MHDDGALSLCECAFFCFFVFFFIQQKNKVASESRIHSASSGRAGRKRPEYFAKLSDWAAYRL